jgi:hypothetical protein
MNPEEQRLSQLLKRFVPEPPVQLSADQITTRPVERSAKSWTLPALAAAAVVVIGVTTGVAATHHSGPGGPTAPTAEGTGRSANGSSGASGTASPSATASCQGRTVAVPNVIGTTQGAAVAVLQQDGLNVETYDAVPPASDRVPAGTVFAQSLTGGSKAVPGAEVQLAIAVAQSTSTAAPVDPGFAVTGSPTPMSPCQAVTGSPAPPGDKTTLPNLIGMTETQAVATAQAAGFTVNVVVTQPPNTQAVQPGIVFAQTPSAGSIARTGSGVSLYVSPAS